MGAHTFQTSSSALWTWVENWWQRASRRTPKRLRLCESLPLGERRFVAVVEFENSRFLVGGTPTTLVLLSPLGNSDEPSQENRRGDRC